MFTWCGLRSCISTAHLFALLQSLHRQRQNILIRVRFKCTICGFTISIFFEISIVQESVNIQNLKTCYNISETEQYLHSQVCGSAVICIICVSNLGHLTWVGMILRWLVVVWYFIRVNCAHSSEFPISRHFRNSSFHKYVNSLNF